MSDLTRSDGSLPLRCTVDRPQPGVCVLHLAGELDMATTPVVAEHLQEQIARRPAQLIVDVSEVTLLAAAAVSLIVDARHDVDVVHGRLCIVGVTGNRPVERVLELTGVRPLLDVHDSVQLVLDGLDHGAHRTTRNSR